MSHRLQRPLYTKYVRFHPITWYGHISMRIGLYGQRAGKEIRSLYGFKIDQFRYIKIQCNTIDLSKPTPNKPHKLSSYSPEPRTEVYCLRLNFRLNFNTSKLLYSASYSCNEQRHEITCERHTSMLFSLCNEPIVSLAASTLFPVIYHLKCEISKRSNVPSSTPKPTTPPPPFVTKIQAT